MADIDWAKVLQDRPDVLAEYNSENTRDAKSRNNLANIGVLNAEDFARWWYNNKPAQDTYVYSAPQVAPVAPTTPPAEIYTPPVVNNPGTNQDGTINTTNGVGAGTSTTPGGNRNTALQQALMNARWQLMGQGLNPDQYMPEVNNYLNDIFNIIPETETNAGSYFDPNFITSFIGGKTAGARANARNFVQNSLSKPNLNYTALDATISRLLGDGLKQGEEYLMRGQKRGQFNEAGYNAGKSRLQDSAARSRAKLRGYASDIFGKYEGQFDDIYNRALGAANSTDLLSGFDITPFARDFDMLSQRVSPEALEGELLNTIGDEPLVDLAGLRTAVGQGQGATNLKDLDVLDGLEKRRKAASAGRGLGSEGAF